MIELNKVYKTYDSLAGKVQALKELNLQIDNGENVAIIGQSGSGKSTLLNIISGIDRPESGTVNIDGIYLNNLSESELAIWRGCNVGIVFQFYQLFPTLSAIDNVLFSMDLVNIISKRNRKDRAISLLEQVGLSDKRKKFPNELSGGEQQRVAIARALSNDPPIIIADEPTGNLDSITGQRIYELFQKLNKSGKTVITVTHENVDQRPYDCILEIKDGVI